MLSDTGFDDKESVGNHFIFKVLHQASLTVFNLLEATYSPSNVCITKLTATSGLVQWTPAHSNYQHEISLNDMLLVCVRPSCSFFTLEGLIPSTLYTLQVKTVLPDSVKLSLGKNIEENICKSIEFTTADGGKFLLFKNGKTNSIMYECFMQCGV